MPTVQQQHIDFFNNPDGIHQWSPQTDDVAYLKNKWKEAIDEKIKQYNSWLESKVVADTDINIIAITYGDSFSASGYCSPISDASAFLFGVSDSCVATVYQDGSSKCETTLNQSSDFVIQDKNNEAKIKKQASFCSKGSNKISGVLFIPDSHKIIDCFTVAVIFVKNPNAINIIDDLLLEKIFKVLRVEEIKDNKFCTTDIISPENQKLLNDYKINTQKLAKDYLNGSITAEVYQDEILGLGRK
jgi:hypothetical protein